MKKSYLLNEGEFATALEKGFGRVYQYIKQNGDELIRDQLLNACLINQTYDRQCEESRAEWLMSLIGLRKNRDFILLKLSMLFL